MKTKFTLLILSFLVCSVFSFGQGINFDGTDDYIQTSYAGITGTGDRTIEAWIKTTGNYNPSNGGTQGVLVDYGTFATGQRFTFNVLWSNAIRLEVGGNGVSGTIAVNDGNWHHVAVVFSNPGNNVALYVDGVLDVQAALTVPANTGTSNNLMIGRRVDGVNHFSGDMDEVRIWNYARTQAEIQANMNSEICSATGLTAYYKFNDGTPNANNTSVTTTMDNSGNGNAGTFNNFALNGNSSNWTTGATLTTGGGNNTFATISGSNCGSYTLPNGNIVTTSGTYMDTIPNTQCGDSIITVNVTINNHTSNSLSLTACNSYTAPNGDTYNSSQIITYTIPNAVGCDSVISLNLTVLNPSSSITETSCGDYTSPSGMVVTTSQIFTDIIPSAAGCDSTITIDLTILNPSSSITETSCGDYISPSGMLVTTSQIFTDIIPSAAGCDSTITIDLTIVEIDTTLAFSLGGHFVASNVLDSNATFQWFECVNDSLILLVGETSQDYYTPTGGFFAVAITLNGCTDTTDCQMVTTSTQNQYLQSTVSLFPNPTNGNFMIDLGETYQNIQVEIYSLDGKMMTNQTFNNQQQIDTKIEAIAGLYQVKITTETGVVNKMVLKE